MPLNKLNISPPSLSAVFHDDRPMTLLSSSLRIQRALFRDVGLLGAFVDSHDAPRFLHRTADRRRLHSALAVTLLGQGIPVLYEGTELGFDGGADPRNRESLWSRIDDRGAVEADETFKFIKRTMQVFTEERKKTFKIIPWSFSGPSSLAGSWLPSAQPHG